MQVGQRRTSSSNDHEAGWEEIVFIKQCAGNNSDHVPPNNYYVTLLAANLVMYRLAHGIKIAGSPQVQR